MIKQSNAQLSRGHFLAGPVLDLDHERKGEVRFGILAYRWGREDCQEREIILVRFRHDLQN